MADALGVAVRTKEGCFMLLHSVPGSCDTQHVGLIHSMTGDAYATCLCFLMWVAVYLFVSSSSSVQGPTCLPSYPADHSGFLSSEVSPFHCTPQAPCELGLCEFPAREYCFTKSRRWWFKMMVQMQTRDTFPGSDSKSLGTVTPGGRSPPQTPRPSRVLASTAQRFSK